MIATKLALVVSDYLIGYGIPLWKEPSPHSLRPILIYYILEIVVSSIVRLHLTEYIGCRSLLWVWHFLLILSEVLLRCVHIIMVLRSSVIGLSLQHLVHVFRALV